MQRALGELPMADEAEYTRSIAEAGFGVTQKGHLTADGLVAYYDTHGRLAEVGSSDDVAHKDCLPQPLRCNATRTAGSPRTPRGSASARSTTTSRAS